MTSGRHIVFLNEFYHPDICASAAVLSDRLPRLARLRPADRLTVVTGNRAWDDATRIYPPREPHEGVQIVRVDRPAVGSRNLFRRGIGFLAFGGKAVQATAQLGPVDLVIGTTAPPHGGGIARRMARKLGCPYVYTVWDLYPDLGASLGRIGSESLLYKLWYARDYVWMRDAARVVSIAEGITKRLQTMRGLGNEKFLTIHDGFDPARLGAWSSEDGAGENSFRREQQSGDRLVVQYAGNMGLSHPFETIVAAAKKMEHDDGVQFQFIGGGPGRSYLMEHLPKNARLIDYQPAERLGELLSATDVCLVSQHQDMHDKALPYKVYGIFAARRPMIFIGHEQSEVAGWLRQSGAGVQLAHGDVDGLVREIRTLKENSDLRRRRGEAGRRLVDTSLHAERSAEKWSQLIDDVVR